MPGTHSGATSSVRSRRALEIEAVRVGAPLGLDEPVGDVALLAPGELPDLAGDPATGSRLDLDQSGAPRPPSAALPPSPSARAREGTGRHERPGEQGSGELLGDAVDPGPVLLLDRSQVQLVGQLDRLFQRDEREAFDPAHVGSGS